MTAPSTVKDSNARIRRLTADDWRLYRSVRLQALRDSPDAFGSTAVDAERLTEAEWKQRLQARAAFVALSEERAAGLVSGIAAERAGEAELISMWVDPACRGTGLGDMLVEAVVLWAIEEGFTRLRLWVAQGNAPAEALYRRNGFLPTGEAQPMGREPARIELAMVRELRR